MGRDEVVRRRRDGIPLVEGKRADIIRLCEQHRVKRLELFGSAAAGGFDPGHSDMDFLVEFLPLRSGECADAYFGLLEALQALFERSVDLVMLDAVSNPYFLQAISESRTVLYAA